MRPRLSEMAALRPSAMLRFYQVPKRSDILWRLGAAILSGVLTALATSLEPYWWAAWLAPIPLLIAAFRSSYATWLWVAIATVIGLVGRASYDVMFLGPVGEAVVALVSVAGVGVVVTLTRTMVQRRRYLLAVFFYPAAAAGLGTILAAVSPHGTAGSLAYSQMKFLPVIQVASLAGTAGIVFMLDLFAALAAIAWHCREEPPRRWAVYGVPSLIIVAVLGYGLARLANGEDVRTFPVGLAVSDVASPASHGAAGTDASDKSWTEYAATVPGLANAGRKDRGLAGKDRAARSARGRACAQIAERRRPRVWCLLGRGRHCDRRRSS
jgi:apolipoprotein N-acyltransferase